MENRGYARCGGREKGAHARPHRAAEPEDATVVRRGELDLLDVIAAVGRGLIVLRARLDPFHRPSELHRAERRDEVSLDLRNLAAEAAADFRRHDAQAILRHAGHRRQDEAHDVRILRRVPERQLAGCRRELRHSPSRLHRRRDQALLDDSIADDDGGGRERSGDVAAFDRPVERHVVRNVRVQLRRAGGSGFLWIDHRRQRLVVDLDQLQRIVGLVFGLGHDDRDRVPDITDCVGRHRAIVGDLQAGVGQEPRAGNALQPGFGVRTGVDSDDARRLLGAAHIDAADASVAVDAAEDRGVDHSWQRKVSRVPRRSGQEPGVLAPADTRSKNTCWRRCGRAHWRPPICAIRGSAAAACTARTMF